VRRDEEDYDKVYSESKFAPKKISRLDDNTFLLSSHEFSTILGNLAFSVLRQEKKPVLVGYCN